MNTKKQSHVIITTYILCSIIIILKYDRICLAWNGMLWYGIGCTYMAEGGIRCMCTHNSHFNIIIRLYLISYNFACDDILDIIMRYAS